MRALLMVGPLVDLQVRSFGLATYSAYVNTFCAASIIVALGTALIALNVARLRLK